MGNARRYYDYLPEYESLTESHPSALTIGTGFWWDCLLSSWNVEGEKGGVIHGKSKTRWQTSSPRT